jgi:integrase
MPSALETALQNCMGNWMLNPAGLPFATPDGSRPRFRAKVVRIGLKPVLKKLGISINVGLHAFRHGLATELAEPSVPIPVLQQQMRHQERRSRDARILVCWLIAH